MKYFTVFNSETGEYEVVTLDEEIGEIEDALGELIGGEGEEE